MAQGSSSYPVTLSVEYPDHDLDRFSAFFRPLFIIPIAAVVTALAALARVTRPWPKRAAPTLRRTARAAPEARASRFTKPR